MRIPMLNVIFFSLLNVISFNATAIWMPGDVRFRADPISISVPIDDGSITQFNGSIYLNQIEACYTEPNNYVRTLNAYMHSAYSGLQVSYNGKLHDIFHSGIEGVGFILSLRAWDSYNDYGWVPLSHNNPTRIMTEGMKVGPTQYMEGTGRFYKIGEVSPGVHTFPTTRVGDFECTDRWGASSIPMYIESTTITVEATTCDVSTSNSVIDFGSLRSSDFPSVGSSTPGKRFTVTLDCDPNVNIYAVVSDQTNKGNRTDTVTLSADSTAKGMGVQVLNVNTGQPYMLGPDSSTPGSENMFLFQHSGSGGPQNFPVDFRYVRTGTIEPGKANALIGITFSYQ